MENARKNSEQFYCESCMFRCIRFTEWLRHIVTRKHLAPKKTPEQIKQFICEKCDLTCYKLSEWKRHISTQKHMKLQKTPEKLQTLFACKKCKKTYTNQCNVNRHEIKCETGIIERLLSDNTELRNLIVEQTNTNSKTIETILLQNNENLTKIMLQNKETIIECCKPINNNTVIHQTNNQKFNIQIFLNEQCKDAINFSDFINNIQISYEDLENNAQLGFVGGISKIFLDNLKQLDVTERPIHCTDVKRETIYIKDENTWTKQPDDKKLQKAIQTVSYRSMGKLAEWKQENPDYKDCNSKFSQKCLDIHRNTLAGSEREVYYPKVIHVLARETAGGLSNTLISTK